MVHNIQIKHKLFEISLKKNLIKWYIKIIQTLIWISFTKTYIFELYKKIYNFWYFLSINFSLQFLDCKKTSEQNKQHTFCPYLQQQLNVKTEIVNMYFMSHKIK